MSRKGEDARVSSI
uniref:Uncharacterized protein n=1 Tax=Rhizophora mucronata TaxID=61149 RepID=A0A2P2JGM4_RHIMU